MKKLLLILTVVLTASVVFGFSITDKTKVIIPENSNECIKYSADEFVKYVEKVSDIKPEIVNRADGKGNVYIYTRKNVPADNDRVNIKVYNGDLYIIGNTDRGTLYSVYEFCEKILGIRFFTKDYTVIPKNKKITVSDTYNYTYKTPFQTRECDYVQAKYNEYSPIARMNGQDGWANPKAGGLNAFACFSSVHTFSRLIPYETYAKDHPEFFAKIDGDPNKIDHNALCLTNKEMRKELAKNTIALLDRARPDNRFIVSVSQNDNMNNECGCAECVAAKEKYGCYAGPLLECVNYVAEEVEKKYPETFVETLAYHKSQDAPKNIKPRKNVVIRLCNTNMKIWEPIAYGTRGKYTPSKANANLYKQLMDWSEIAQQVYIWDYVTCFQGYTLIHPNFNILKQNINFYKDNKVIAVFEETDRSNYNVSFNELKHYIISKLLWNPSLDVKALTKEFCHGVYKEGAEDILKVIDIINKADITGYKQDWNNANADWITEKDMISSIKYLQSALRKTAPKDTENPLFRPVAEIKENEIGTSYDRIYSLYVYYLSGWRTKPDETFEKIKKECSLPWNTKDEFYDYMAQYSIQHNNPNYTEHMKFDMSDAARKWAKTEPTPDIVKGLPENEWFEVNDRELGVLGEFGASVKVDKSVPDGYVGEFTCNGKWGTHTDIIGNIAKARKEGYKSVDIYAVCKSGNKTGNSKNSLKLGVYDYDKKQAVFSGTVKAEEISDDWKTIHFGNWEFGSCRNSYFYLVAGQDLDNNPDTAQTFDKIYVEKVIFVFKK